MATSDAPSFCNLFAWEDIALSILALLEAKTISAFKCTCKAFCRSSFIEPAVKMRIEAIISSLIRSQSCHEMSCLRYDLKSHVKLLPNETWQEFLPLIESYAEPFEKKKFVSVRFVRAICALFSLLRCRLSLTSCLQHRKVSDRTHSHGDQRRGGLEFRFRWLGWEARARGPEREDLSSPRAGAA
mmetsp:Transcript_18553/g.42345  ORF Transcript_18553/g.42345 Transcript_18553/m.42345 type:complete len:185 (+) Transcript_18553:149-703(+)